MSNPDPYADDPRPFEGNDGLLADDEPDQEALLDQIALYVRGAVSCVESAQRLGESIDADVVAAHVGGLEGVESWLRGAKTLAIGVEVLHYLREMFHAEDGHEFIEAGFNLGTHLLLELNPFTAALDALITICTGDEDWPTSALEGALHFGDEMTEALMTNFRESAPDWVLDREDCATGGEFDEGGGPNGEIRAPDRRCNATIDEN